MDQWNVYIYIYIFKYVPMYMYVCVYVLCVKLELGFITFNKII